MLDVLLNVYNYIVYTIKNIMLGKGQIRKIGNFLSPFSIEKGVAVLKNSNDKKVHKIA